MGKVQSGYIHAGFTHLCQYRFAFACRSDGTNNLCFSHNACSPVSIQIFLYPLSFILSHTDGICADIPPDDQPTRRRGKKSGFRGQNSLHEQPLLCHMAHRKETKPDSPDLRNNGRFPFPEHCLGNAKLSCIIQVILRLPVMHTAAKHIDLLLHSTGICYIHLHRHAKHKRRNDHSGTDQHNMMFLFGPFSEMLMHLQSHLPELPSLVDRTLSWRNGSLPSAPQW